MLLLKKLYTKRIQVFNLLYEWGLGFFSRWECDLHISFTTKHRESIVHFIHEISIFSKNQEIGIKAAYMLVENQGQWGNNGRTHLYLTTYPVPRGPFQNPNSLTTCHNAFPIHATYGLPCPLPPLKPLSRSLPTVFIMLTAGPIYKTSWKPAVDALSYNTLITPPPCLCIVRFWQCNAMLVYPLSSSSWP